MKKKFAKVWSPFEMFLWALWSWGMSPSTIPTHKNWGFCASLYRWLSQVKSSACVLEVACTMQTHLSLFENIHVSRKTHPTLLHRHLKCARWHEAQTRGEDLTWEAATPQLKYWIRLAVSCFSPVNNSCTYGETPGGGRPEGTSSVAFYMSGLALCILKFNEDHPIPLHSLSKRCVCGGGRGVNARQQEETRHTWALSSENN